ncbi:hypothetical protein ACB098_04G072000 [Castanea mollissima]
MMPTGCLRSIMIVSAELLFGWSTSRRELLWLDPFNLDTYLCTLMRVCGVLYHYRFGVNCPENRLYSKMYVKI